MSLIPARLFARATSFAALIALTLVAAPALGAWTQVYPGVDYSQWTNGTPQRISAVRADLCYPGVSLRATKSAERQQTPSSFGQATGAEVVVNGDFFSWDGYGTTGLAIGDGQVWPGSSDTPSHGFVAFGDGRALVSNPPEHVTDIGWMNDAVGGNILVLNNGQVTGDTGSFCTTRHPRTVAGLSQDGRTLYLVVVDGRSTSSVGMRCDELGQLMKNLGAWTALNLDGGGSTAMWMRGHGVVSVPSDGSQRVVANHLAIQAEGDGRPEACNDMDATFEVNMLGLDDFYTDGSSGGVPDALVGDRFEAEILLQNSSGTILRGVQADYWFETPFLTPRSYTIFSDHPEYDQATWTVNSADGDESNPPRDQMGQTGPLEMHAFSVGETKRVLLDMEATRYSIGGADHPDVRGWVRHIDNIYGEQTAWDQQPSNANNIGVLLQNYAQIDVLSPYEWQFNGGEGELEGWSACPTSENGPATSAAQPGTMMLEGAQACAQSPDWTAVDADTYDQLVIRINGGTGGAPLEVQWARNGEELGDSARTAGFEARAEAGMVSYVVPLGALDDWAEEVARLKLAPHGDWAGQIAIDAIFFQNSADSTTSSADEDFVDEPPVEFIDLEETNGDDAGASGEDAGPGYDAGSSGDAGDEDAGWVGDSGSSAGGTHVSGSGEACACGVLNGAPPALPWLAFGCVFLLIRRRRVSQ